MIIDIAKGIIVSSFELFAAMAPYLLFGFLFAGILNELISAEKIARHLGKSSFGSVIKAALFGIPLPLCSCGVIPPTMALRKNGASRGAVLSFLIATPTSGVDSIFATYSLLGPFFAAYRVAASFITGIFSGSMANLLDRKNSEPAKTPNDDEKITNTNISPIRRAVNILHYAYIELLGEIGRWLLIGILIGGIITFAIPDSFFSTQLFSGWKAMLMMLIVSVPIYVCATGSIPIAAALMLKGMNPGAAFVFLLAGPATNAVTMTVISRYLGKKTAAIYITTLAISTIVFGLLLDAVWEKLGLSIALQHIGHNILPLWLQWTSAFLLLALLTIALLLRIDPNFFSKNKPILTGGSEMLSTFNVPDMSCNHCVMSIENALKTVEGIDNIVITLGTKEVKIEHAQNLQKSLMIQAIKGAGYSVADE